MVGYLKSVRTERSSRRIFNRLKEHARLMAQYEAEGMSKADASRKAFEEVTGCKRKQP